MSEASVAARAAMKKKIERLTTDPHEKVDASSWEPGDPMNASSKTGMRPISKRAYKRGGKVEGEKTKAHMGRRPRKSGGLAVELMNRNQKDANAEREGGKHIGGLKSGGRAKKAGGGGFTDPRVAATEALGASANRAGVPTGVMNFTSNPASAFGRQMGIKTGGRVKKAAGGKTDHWIKDAIKHPGALHKELHVPVGKDIPAAKLKKAEDSKSPVVAKRARLAETLKAMHRKDGGDVIAKDDPSGSRPTGGRIARKDGGRAKGKTNINIVIGAPKPAMPPMSPGGPPPGAMPPPPPPQMSAGAPPGAPAGGGMPIPQMPQGGPPMVRKAGGRVPHMEAGAGSGLGRLEKVAIQKRADD